MDTGVLTFPSSYPAALPLAGSFRIIVLNTERGFSVAAGKTSLWCTQVGNQAAAMIKSSAVMSGFVLNRANSTATPVPLPSPS